MKILRKKEVIERVGYSGVHLWRLEQRGAFPKRIELQPRGAVGWLEHEVDQWIRARVSERDRDRADR